VLSHPDNAFYSLTEGVVSRYFVYRNQGKATTMLATTAEFAVGSSGAPLLDDCGNVIGMVSSTSSIYSGPATMDGEGEISGSAPEADSNGDLQMVMKMCVPSADILKLLGK
jgi:S1-C subfamily serine protease